ncbi:MAG: hypothetical protein IK093_12095, partial [Ruminiclostridium sp.]|nr:hypothetical protein [Ruminiclostridium sp.]
QFTMPAGDVTVSAEFAPLVTVTMGLAIFDGSEIGVDFGFTPADGEDVDDYTVEINGVSHTLASLETSGVYKTRVSMVAKKMRDPITVVVKKSGTIVKSVTTSIYDYSMIVLADNNYSAAHELIEAMLNYGAYSQLYFNYNTENLANEDIEDHTNFIDIKYNNLPIDKDEFNKFLESINAPVTYTGMNLTLESQTNLNLFFDLKNGHSSGELVDFISYISVFSCTYNIFSENDDTRLRIVMKEIPISNLYQQALIQFPGSNDSKTVSIDMYFKLAMEQGSDEVKLLCNALYNFFDKSRSYNPG